MALSVPGRASRPVWNKNENLSQRCGPAMADLFFAPNGTVAAAVRRMGVWLSQRSWPAVFMTGRAAGRLFRVVSWRPCASGSCSHAGHHHRPLC